MNLIRSILVMALLMVTIASVQAAAVCSASITATTPSTDFIDHGNGTVTHSRTGLMWQRCALGQNWSAGTCADTASTATWSEALKAARNSITAGYSDWRLPNVKELSTIVEEKCYSPSVNEVIFPNTSASNFWSASAYAGSSSYAWYVYFYSGSADYHGYKSNAFQVRLVRAGQSFDSFDSLNPSTLSIPGVPTGIVASPVGSNQVTVSFTRPANDGGAAITGYTATCGGISATGSTSPITVSGVTLTHHTATTCTVIATNSMGSGPASVASNTVMLATSPNDTGITDCWNDTGIDNTTGIEADTGTHPRQDCRYGRDAAAKAGQLTKVGGGSKGFDFTKIANNGTVTTADLGSAPTDWACTQDNVTGLIWEVKTTSNPRGWGYTYTWYNSNAATNGGNAGTESQGRCAATGRCDTKKYVEDVNATGLCGASDWRMPSTDELMTLVDYGIASPGPTIDTTWFPHTSGSPFWSASANAGNSLNAWSVSFYFGVAAYNDKSWDLEVRLVRAGQ